VVYLNNIHYHDLEPWTLAFSGNGSTNVLSGGDDIVLQYSYMNHLQGRTLLWQDSRIHQAGITAILPLASNLVITGSYDDHIRLISYPTIGSGRRQVLAEQDLGGGVWRIKLIEAIHLPHRAGDASDSGSENPTATPEPTR
jgi:diphthamide biosynthesis protein 7